MKIFGYTTFAIRVVPALAGLAAVVAFYPLARHLFGIVPAVVATALFAVSRWAVTFSRVSWEASIQPVIEILAIYFIIRGIDRGSRVSFAFGGVALAAGLYSYIAFRMVPIFVVLLLLYVAATQWRSIRSNATGLAVFALAFLAAVAPLANFALHNQDRFLQRTRDVNVFREIDREGSYEPLRHNVRATLKMMNVGATSRPQASWRAGGDNIWRRHPGLGAGVWSIRNWRRGSLALWFGLSLIPGALIAHRESVPFAPLVLRRSTCSSASPSRPFTGRLLRRAMACSCSGGLR
jgi:4-amino-4-deoxy-L-arabinose transferase-like glycosyltransferase